MNRLVRFILAQPMPFTPNTDGRVIEWKNTDIEVDLYEGTVTLPDGKKVLASSFVDCADRIHKAMQKWRDEIGGQVNPIWHNPPNRNTVLQQLERSLVRVRLALREAGYRDAWYRGKLEGQEDALGLAIDIVRGDTNV